VVEGEEEEKVPIDMVRATRLQRGGNEGNQKKGGNYLEFGGRARILEGGVEKYAYDSVERRVRKHMMFWGGETDNIICLEGSDHITLSRTTKRSKEQKSGGEGVNESQKGKPENH